MNKTLRTFILLAIVIVICVSTVTIAFAAANIPAATSDFYVNDFAGVFTEAEKAQLMDKAVALANEHDGIQVVVTTVKSLNGNTVEDYAYQMYNQYGIGKDDMGLLILLATDDRQIRVEVGRAMEAYINDAKAGRFMDKYAIPHLKENRFNEGLMSLQEAFITEISSCISAEVQTENKGDTEVNINWEAGLFAILITLGTGGIIWLVIFVVNKAKKKKQQQQEYIKDLNDTIARLNESVDGLQTSNANLRAQNNHLHDELNTTKQSLATLEIRHKRILTIYPDADKRVDEMIEAEKVARDKAAAHKVDLLIVSVINLKPDKDLVQRLESIMYEIQLLSSDEAKYIESDLNQFRNLYSASRALKRDYEVKLEEERRRKLTEQRKANAINITKQLLRIISMVGIVGANDLSRLREAKSLYENLDRETRSYVDSSAISKIEDLFKRAKRAKEEADEEERRRRQNLYHSTSSFSSGSSGFGGFGGFGGRSGGGGASRGF